MNKTRRRSIQQIIDHLIELKEHIDLLRDEEQEAYDNLPESLQESERGEAMSASIYQMEDAMEDIELALDALDEAMQ